MTPVIIAFCLGLAQLAGAPAEGAKADAPAKANAKTKQLENMAHRALKRVEGMRKQKLSKPLKMGVKSKAEVTKFIQSRLKEEYGPAKVKAEGMLLGLQGLLPRDMDYGGFITQLLAEQVAGFYDHTRQELHIAAWLPLLMQEPVMAHEIFHAIQDQEWGGGKLIDSKKYSHDAVIAHASLLEGDATIVMLNYQQAAAGSYVDVTESPFTIKMVATSLPLQMASPQFPVMAVAPDYLKQSLIFPYQQGLLFIAALREANLTWDDIRKVYDDPPGSTEQILHPERYYGVRDVPGEVVLPKRSGFTRGWGEVAGEFHMRQLLLAHLSLTDAIDAAAGWDGDRTVVETQGKTQVAYAMTTWDTEGDAAVFAAALKKAHAARAEPKPHLIVTVRGYDLAFAHADDLLQAKAAVEFALANAKITHRRAEKK